MIIITVTVPLNENRISNINQQTTQNNFVLIGYTILFMTQSIKKSVQRAVMHER
jgi:hypothetical protein